MCIMILNKGEQIPFNSFHSMWLMNRDGLGMMYHGLDDEIITQKFMIENREQLWNWYCNYYIPLKHSTRIDNLCIHFRYATDGDICVDNTHPYSFTDMHGVDCALMHNGIMPQKYRGFNCYPDDYDVISSDTANFVNLFLYENFTFNKLTQKAHKVIEDEIGDASKLIVLNGLSSAIIFNEDAGTWIDENWFSNMHWWAKGGFDMVNKNKAKTEYNTIW